MSKLIHAAASGLLVVCSAQAAAAEQPIAGTDAIIQGFAKYQAGRVEKLVLDEFLTDLVKQSLVVKFFPQASGSVSGFDGVSGKRLLPLIQYYFKEDLGVIEEVAKCLTPLGADLKFSLDAILNKTSIDRLKAFVSSVRDGSGTPQSFKEQNCGSASATDVAKTVTSAGEPDADTKGIIETAEALVAVKAEAIATIPSDTLNRSLQADKVAASALSQVRPSLDVFFDANLPKSVTGPGAAKKLKDSLKLLKDTGKVDPGDVIQALVSLGALQNADTDPNVAEKPPKAAVVKQFLGLLEALGFGVDESRKFARFKDQALFLASLRDAGDTHNPEAVRQVIADFVDDQTTLREKRSEVATFTWRSGSAPNSACLPWVLFCHDMIFLNSYFGLSMANADEDGIGGKEIKGRAYGPVGVEVKVLNLRGWPISLGYAPFDIGAYVTNELRGESYDSKLDDLKTPSFYVSVSVKDRPFALLAGYQKDVKVASGNEIEYGFVSVAFELPLFTVW